jgi:hypothetical protein
MVKKMTEILTACSRPGQCASQKMTEKKKNDILLKKRDIFLKK